MDEIKKLFQAKRIFAMILAAAMVITMLPTTANAASISGDTLNETQEANAASDTDGSVVIESLQLDTEGEADAVWGFVDNRSDSDKTAVYGANPGDAGNPGNLQYFTEGLENIVITKDGSEYKTLYSDDTCTKEWQKKTGTGNDDKDYTALGEEEFPTDAGEYRLVVTAPDGKTKGSFIFKITAYEPEVAIELEGEIEAGTAKKDVEPESFISSLYFHNGKSSYHEDPATGNYGYGPEKIYFTTTLDDGEVSGRETPIPATIEVAVAQIRNAITGEALADTDVLTKDQDYVIDLTLTFKEEAAKLYGTNYKLPGIYSKLVTISNLIKPDVVVDLGEKAVLDDAGKPVMGDDGKAEMEPVTEIERNYTGKAVEAPKKTEEYTVKIVLGDEKEIPVNDEDLTMSWCDRNGNELTSAPIEAGRYNYRITYNGQTGVYAEAYADIPVVIKPTELTIVPKTISGAKFYPGMTVKQALAQIDYTVLDADGDSFDANVDRNSFWGTREYGSTTYPYEPVFGIQVKTGSEEIIPDDGSPTTTVDKWSSDLNGSTILQSGETYRVVFTGRKAVYSGSGIAYSIGINSSANGFNASYQVETGTEAIAENALAITLEEGTEAVITSNLTKDGVGSSYDNPITKAYDGAGIYAKRADYKLATVVANGKTIAEKTNSAITYTWERQKGTKTITDADGNTTEEPNWVSYDYNSTNLSALVSPSNAGKYRLTISYVDSKNGKDNRGYYAPSIEVYYEITTQNLLLETVDPEGGYSAPVGYTVAQFLYNIEHSENLDLAGYLPHKLYEFSGKLEDYQPKTEDVMYWLYGWVDIFSGEAEYWHPYDIEWSVEKKNDKNEWVELGDNETFESDGEYRLIPETWEIDPDYSSYSHNYETYETWVDEDDTEWIRYFAYGVPINLTTQGTVSLGVELDASEITAKTTKEYDGTPIDILDEVKQKLVIYKQDDEKKTPVTDVLSDIQFVWNGNNGISVVNAEPVDAGTYSLYVKFLGNESYKAFSANNFLLNTGLTVTITKREITVVPSLKEPIVAGYCNPSQYYDWSKTTFTNVALCDEEAFTYKIVGGFSAVKGYGGSIYDADGKAVYTKLKGDTEYTFRFSYMSLRDIYANNYALVYKGVPFTTVRGYSTVVGTSYSSYGIKAYQFNDSKTDVDGIGTHTITANEGIEYKYDIYNSETKEYKDGNFIVLQIRIPEEYNYLSEAEVVYANSIEKAGGCILNKSSIENYPYYNYINVLFNAEDGKEKPIEFDIRWEEGYVEHFILDFTKAELLEDLRNAVAPKTISLVSPSKTMAVGGTQQLDVKMTTSQIGDLVHLTYTVDKPEVLCVTENGKVTALAEGDATITIESTRRGENGEYVSTIPAKKTTVKIKVSKVSAPKIKKVDNILDTTAKIWWTQLDSNDGDRREVYVLEGKTNYTKDEFETKIASMKNGNWEDIFAIAPIRSTYYDSNAKLAYRTISGLKPDTAYTVYIRNVNRAETLDDGCKVAESHDGSVKGFKTTKGQMIGLAIDFNDKNVVRYMDIENYTSYYMIALSYGTTTVSVSGYFSEWVNAAGDYDWKVLPLSKEDQKEYVNPKLEYMVGEIEILDGLDSEKDGYIGYNSYYDSDDDEWYYRYYYLNKTTKASIDQKGKLKLNGVGEVDVVVRDKTTGKWTYKTLEITATADDIASKATKIQVGQKILLEDLITYKEGKKVLTGDYARKIVVDDALRDAISKSESFELSSDERYLIAVKAGNLSLTLKDAYIGEGKTATATLKAAVLDPVKNLKATTVTDSYFDIEFTHSLNPESAGYKDNLLYAEGLGFRIKVTDARGTLLKSLYVKANSIYDHDTGKYAYRISGLTKKSKYNVSVTAEFKTETSETAVSKETKKAITTTLLPASYISLAKGDSGGISVYVHGNSSNTIWSYDFYTGNSYTLEVGGAAFNAGAKAAMTDTLTWTSSNSKVATVKANAGSYSASLKAVGQGTTTIEIKSKITKAVIARYNITVSAVGDAYSNPKNPIFFGENEYLQKNTVSSMIGYALKNGAVALSH